MKTTKRAKPKVKPKATKRLEWVVLKSGARRHKDGLWFAAEFLTGWHLYSRSHEHLGPFKTFEEGSDVFKKSKKGSK